MQIGIDVHVHAADSQPKRIAGLARVAVDPARPKPAGGISLRKLAADFGVTGMAVNRIVNGRTYRTVP
jgi:hypothetical protein